MSSPGLPSPVNEGDVVAGKYAIERVLGRGGMGTVFAARHLELRIQVALKLLISEGAKDPDAVARFQREARAAVSLKSEHSVRVMDVGKTRDGTPFIVMELLTGTDLAELVERQGPLSVSDAVEYVLQACEAIAEAHALGIVHRDLKPQNLFLTRRVDGRPLVKVLDFGIAKSLSPSALDQRALTRSATMMGSPMYMSPEQVRASKSLDARSDIWAIGVCLYELLTGAMPFDAKTGPELCKSILKDPPRHPRVLAPDLPEPLCAVLLRCLEKDPAARFRDVGALALELEPFAPKGARVAASQIRAILDRPPPAPASLASPALDPEKDRPEVEKAGTTTEATFATGPRTRSVWSLAAAAASVAIVASLIGFLALRRGDETRAIKGAPVPSSVARAPVAGEPSGSVPSETAPAEGPSPSGATSETPARPLPTPLTVRPATRTIAPRPSRTHPPDAGAPAARF